MHSFSDFGIKPQTAALRGDKIKIERVLNTQIVVEVFRIEKSKVKDGTQCLYMQIIIDNDTRVIFSGSTCLIEMIQRIPKEKFPFTTKIIKQENRLEFT